MNDVFSFVASRVSPRRATHFLLLRQEKVSKEKATRVFASPSLRYGATCAAHEARAGRKLALRAQTCVPLHPRFAALLGATTREGRGENQYQDTRAGESGSRSLPLRWCKAPAAAPGFHAPGSPVLQLPCRRAEERRGGRMKQAACLSEASLQIARPHRAPQVALRTAKGHAYQGRLLFAYFLLAKQEKVSRPPGRDPACHENKTTKQKRKC
jgi:hypothetical protein